MNKIQLTYSTTDAGETPYTLLVQNDRLKMVIDCATQADAEHAATVYIGAGLARKVRIFKGDDCIIWWNSHGGDVVSIVNVIANHFEASDRGRSVWRQKLQTHAKQWWEDNKDSLSPED